MLHHISWSTYLQIVLAGVLVYYLWFALRFYRKELMARLGGRSASSEDQTFIPSITPVMGAIADEPEQVSGSEELLFGDTAPDDVTDHQVDPDTHYGRSRFLTEVEALIRVVAESAEPKAHFLLLAGLLTEKYATVISAHDRAMVAQRLIDPSNGFAFELEAEDLNDLWREPINI